MTVLPVTEWLHRPGLAALVAALGGSDWTRLVGGAVRDGLLGLPVSDIDLATRLTPAQVLERLSAAGVKAVPTGIAHGTITALTAGGPVEVTTLRRDVATDGRHAQVAFSEDWREDASRRDFTINALYADPETGRVDDWFDGVNDLKAGRVAFIGNPQARIAEDHLRILRFFRFHARFGHGEPEPGGLAACAARANDLMALSRERIAAELLKILAVRDPAPTVATMLTHGILTPVLPEIVDSARLARLVGREVELGVPGDPIRRLATLIGPDPDTAASIARRLRLSRAQAKRLVEAGQPIDISTQALAYRIGVESTVDRLLIGDGSAGDIAALTGWSRPVLGIGGGTLIARGLPAGPVVARTLAMIETRWAAAGFPRDAALDAIVDAALSEAR